jgi:hypothetical protein
MSNISLGSNSFTVPSNAILYLNLGNNDKFWKKKNDREYQLRLDSGDILKVHRRTYKRFRVHNADTVFSYHSREDDDCKALVYFSTEKGKFIASGQIDKLMRFYSQIEDVPGLPQEIRISTLNLLKTLEQKLEGGRV